MILLRRVLKHFVFATRRPVENFKDHARRCVEVVRHRTKRGNRSIQSFNMSVTSQFRRVFHARSTSIFRDLCLIRIVVSNVSRNGNRTLSLGSNLVRFFTIASFCLPRNEAMMILALRQAIHREIPFVFHYEFQQNGPCLLNDARGERHNGFTCRNAIIA